MKRRRPPLRVCVDCRGPVYSWSESGRRAACWQRTYNLGPVGLAPGGVAAEARARRLQHEAEVGAKIARGEL